MPEAARPRSSRSRAASGRASTSSSISATAPPTRTLPGIEVVRTLEAHGVAFTGATSEFYEPSREAMKLACRAEGIATPDYVLARERGRCRARRRSVLRFPLFVKHYSSYSSVDLSRRSRVLHAGRTAPAGAQDHAAPRRGADRGVHRGHGVHGPRRRRIRTTRRGPRPTRRSNTAFPTARPSSTREMKWVDYGRMAAFPVADPVLDARLRDVSARFFVALNGASFGRCDLRVDHERHAVHAGDQSELRRLLPAHGCRQRRPLPRARSGGPRGLHAPVDPRGAASTATGKGADAAGIRSAKSNAVTVTSALPPDSRP